MVGKDIINTVGFFQVKVPVQEQGGSSFVSYVRVLAHFIGERFEWLKLLVTLLQ